jgi:hypothetical protein
LGARLLVSEKPVAPPASSDFLWRSPDHTWPGPRLSSLFFRRPSLGLPPRQVHVGLNPAWCAALLACFFIARVELLAPATNGVGSPALRSLAKVKL